MMFLASTLFNVLEFLSLLFIFAVGSALSFLTAVYVLDRRQHGDAILRNYPVIGHMRHILSSLGEFLRQYFFAMDRDELPFNRAERNWVENASKNADPTIAFVSERGQPRPADLPFPVRAAGPPLEVVR